MLGTSVHLSSLFLLMEPVNETSLTSISQVLGNQQPLCYTFFLLQSGPCTL